MEFEHEGMTLLAKAFEAQTNREITFRINEYISQTEHPIDVLVDATSVTQFILHQALANNPMSMKRMATVQIPENQTTDLVAKVLQIAVTPPENNEPNEDTLEVADMYFGLLDENDVDGSYENVVTFLKSWVMALQQCDIVPAPNMS